ncbi:MAG: hypothetical protein ACI3X7_01085 [Bacteroidaceae bacterium]
MTKDFVELRDLKAVLDEVAAADHAEYRVVPATEILCGQTVEKEGFDIEITKFVSDRVMQKTKDFWDAKVYAPQATATPQDTQHLWRRDDISSLTGAWGHAVHQK